MILKILISFSVFLALVNARPDDILKTRIVEEDELAFVENEDQQPGESLEDKRHKGAPFSSIFPIQLIAFKKRALFIHESAREGI